MCKETFDCLLSGPNRNAIQTQSIVVDRLFLSPSNVVLNWGTCMRPELLRFPLQNARAEEGHASISIAMTSIDQFARQLKPRKVAKTFWQPRWSAAPQLSLEKTCSTQVWFQSFSGIAWLPPLGNEISLLLSCSIAALYSGESKTKKTLLIVHYTICRVSRAVPCFTLFPIQQRDQQRECEVLKDKNGYV